MQSTSDARSFANGCEQQQTCRGGDRNHDGNSRPAWKMIRAFDRDELIPWDGLDELTEVGKLLWACEQALERESKILVGQLMLDAWRAEAFELSGVL